ncbi:MULTISPECIES: hypothetical protein [Methylomonas]|uniref:hypothetical protein n=1 Tax=Methylomonas TaxID=416 RepID=UPI001231D1F0|nr:hypothetical protein [Methylomonas rhizoryzae]
MAYPGFNLFPAAVATLLTTVACSAVIPASGPFDSFAAYAESVFRRQNELSSRLMMLSASNLLQDTEQLDDAEHAMNDACHLLTEYAERENAGESISLMFKRQVKDSIEVCDLQIHQLEQMLLTLGH